MPAPPATPGPAGWCTGGDPQTGTLPTIPGYEFFNGLWAEIKAILTAAGITPSASDLTQMLQALNALFIAAAGDTMTGQLTLVGDPTAANHAARKGYVDARVAKAGDTMTGQLTLVGDPTALGHAAQKSYVDGQVATRATYTYVDGQVATRATWAYVDGTNALTGVGYKIFPGGLIIQWGFVGAATRSISASASVVFPLTFPAACFAVIPTIEGFDSAGLLDMAAGTGPLSAGGVDLYAGSTLTEGSEVRTFGWRWIALGV
ncbi:gp53-like domain-containing protein [Neoroseomonas lacus]|nr:hypothetical protein [Neoroseomonas lacus]